MSSPNDPTPTAERPVLHAAVYGHGNVGTAVAVALASAGHQITFAVGDDRRANAEAAAAAQPALADAGFAPPADAVAAADVAVLALPFGTLADALPPIADAASGRLVIDATNPVGPGLTHGLGSQRSGSQVVAELLPDSRVAKAFSVYGFENFASAPAHPDGLRAVMPFATDDEQARTELSGLLDQLGWEPFDAGGLAAAVDLEHLTLLWVRHVRAGGNPPQLTWAALRS